MYWVNDLNRIKNERQGKNQGYLIEAEILEAAAWNARQRLEEAKTVVAVGLLAPLQPLLSRRWNHTEAQI